MKIRQKIGIIIVSCLLFGNIISILLNFNISLVNDYTKTNLYDEIKPISSGYWGLSPFVIDDNGSGDYMWTQAALEEWCSGSGTFSDPYLIHNITINGFNSSNCLTIRNSEVFFEIKNCTFKNSSGILSYDAGLYLYNVSNSFIIENNCSINNGNGIMLIECYNISISKSQILSNKRGIFLRNSQLITLNNNSITQNQEESIKMETSNFNQVLNNSILNNGGNTLYMYYSGSNVIQGNTIINNVQGISLQMHSDNNEIINNSIKKSNSHGIIISNSHQCIVKNNQITQHWRGIQLANSSSNNIIRNMIYNNSGDGLNVQNLASDSSFLYNNIYNNTGYGLAFYDGSENNNIRGNSFFNNSLGAGYDDCQNNNWDDGFYGNYWGDYLDKYPLANNDGYVWDTSYTISGSGNSQDNYPLVTRIEEGYWYHSPITIDDLDPSKSWIKKSHEFYSCKGTGSEDDPYIIVNMIIDGKGASKCLEILNSQKYFIFQECIFLNSLDGIYFSNVQNGKIYSSSIYEINSNGIEILNSHNNSFGLNNISLCNNNGMFFDHSHNNAIFQNNVSNSGNFGVAFFYCNSSFVSNNFVTFNDGGGIYFGYQSSRNIIQDNVIQDNQGKGIFWNQVTNSSIVNNIIKGNSELGVSIWVSINHTIHSNTVFNNTQGGIKISTGTHTIISNNILAYNKYIGCEVVNSNNTRIVNNTITNNERAVQLSDTIDTQFVLNELFNNTDQGLYISDSINSTIKNNNLSFNIGSGICLTYSEGLTVINNTMINNTQNGVYIYNTNHSSISQNKIEKNSQYGIRIYNFYAENNGIWMNYIRNNLIEQAIDDGTNTRWDNGSHGNYWGDYEEDYPGASNNGLIWNISYIIPGLTASLDRYPMVFSIPLTINNPMDISYEFNTTGNQITWVISDNVYSSPNFTIYENNIEIFNDTWIPGVSINLNTDNLEIGTYNFSIIANNGIDEEIQDDVIITVLNYASNFDDYPLNNINYEYSVTRNELSWTITDNSVNFPTYLIYRNGIELVNLTWNSGVPINISIDGLDLGIYNYTIYVFDGLGESIEDQVTISVENYIPTLSNPPTNINYEYSATGNELSWTITDNSVNNPTYVIYRNGTELVNQSWTSGVPITINIDGLSIGIYNYTIIISDEMGEIVSDEVIVIVTQPSVNGIQPFPSEFLPIIILALISAVILIGSIGYYAVKKKKKLNRMNMYREKVIREEEPKFIERRDKVKEPLEKTPYIRAKNNDFSETLRKKIEDYKIEEKKPEITIELQSKILETEKLIKDMKYKDAKSELKAIKKEATLYKLDEIGKWADKNTILCNTRYIKKTIINLGSKFTRLEIVEIVEKTGIEDDGLIIKTVIDMIKSKEIYAEYFSSSKVVAFNQQAIIKDIDKLMNTYKEWEHDETGKK